MSIIVHNLVIFCFCCWKRHQKSNILDQKQMFQSSWYIFGCVWMDGWNPIKSNNMFQTHTHTTLAFDYVIKSLAWWWWWRWWYKDMMMITKVQNQKSLLIYLNKQTNKQKPENNTNILASEHFGNKKLINQTISCCCFFLSSK